VKQLLTFAFAVMLFVVTGFSIVKNSDPSTATVNQVNGFFIYTDCQPVATFRCLGSTLTRFTGDFTADRHTALSQLRNDYPTATGAMIVFTGSHLQVTAITFNQ